MVEITEGVGIFPKEAKAKVKDSKRSLLVGMPAETAEQENRVILTPDAIALLVNNGMEVMVETMAGARSKFTDKEYADAGAKIVYTAKEAFDAEVVIKVEPPTTEEIGYMRSGACLISALQLGKQHSDFIHALNSKRVTAVAYEFLEDKVGGMPAIRAMSEIAGSTVMLIASEYLSSSNNGKGLLLGGVTGVPPTQVVIVGAGTVAEYASRTALGLGANIKVFDNHIYKLRRIKQLLGQQVFTSTIDNNTIANAIREADVVIGAMRAEKGKNKMVVTEDMVASMMEGSVIIDVSIDQGGCIETSEMTSHDNPTFVKHGIIHYCVPNIASRVSRTASVALSNIFTPILLQMADLGGAEEMVFNYKWFMKGVYTYRGSLTNAYLARKFAMTHKELLLLLAARY